MPYRNEAPAVCRQCGEVADEDLFCDAHRPKNPFHKRRVGDGMARASNGELLANAYARAFMAAFNHNIRHCKGDS